MTSTQSPAYEVITRPDRLAEAVRQMAGLDMIALDTESNSRYRYPEQLCLLQIGTPQKVYIIDTILLKDISLLKTILESRSIQKVIHGADYDIRCLDRHYGFRIHNLFDTSVAGRFAGAAEFGLAALCKNMIGVNLTKDERLQLSDWGRRPLSGAALDYAAGDVRHLFDLRQKLVGCVQRLGRSAWVDEECARLEEVRYNAPDLNTAFFYIKGGQDLDAAGLAVLRRLYLFREEESLRQGRPPYFVISDQTLVDLAANPGADLSKMRGLGYTGLQRFGDKLRQVLNEGRSAPPIRRPAPVNERLSPLQSERLKKLKSWRVGMSAGLGLDPSLLWPTASLERIARVPGSFESEAVSGLIRLWQREQFGPSLRAFLKSLS